MTATHAQDGPYLWLTLRLSRDEAAMLAREMEIRADEMLPTRPETALVRQLEHALKAAQRARA